MNVEERNLYNRVTFIINDDWTKCIDKFGITRTKAYAVSYRENSRRLVNQGVTFERWCIENEQNDLESKEIIGKGV